MTQISLAELVKSIGSLDAAAMTATQNRLDMLTKPPGSLGILERLVVQMAGIQGRTPPVAYPAAVIVMAADHGVVAEGVSAFPAEVTPQMVYNFLRGGAAINVLSRQAGAKVYVVDVGVNADLDVAPGTAGFLSRKVRYGTANMARVPAMTRAEAEQAIAAGAEVAALACADGAQVLALGEMGIGNTTAATALLCALRGHAPAEVTGRGTGVDDAGRQRKIATIERTLALHHPDPADPLGVLAAVGGLEIAALAGVALQAAALRRPVVVDGLIATSAALVARDLCPAVAPYLIPSHLSQEPGHIAMLSHLDITPLLHLDMRLGEGTGAAIALPILVAATRLLTEMATFAEAGVSEGD